MQCIDLCLSFNLRCFVLCSRVQRGDHGLCRCGAVSQLARGVRQGAGLHLGYPCGRGQEDHAWHPSVRDCTQVQEREITQRRSERSDWPRDGKHSILRHRDTHTHTHTHTHRNTHTRFPPRLFSFHINTLRRAQGEVFPWLQSLISFFFSSSFSHPLH